LGRVVHISDTAFLIAGLRAGENDRAQPLFRDPLARKLAGDFGKKAPSTKGLMISPGRWRFGPSSSTT
jgi:O-methyltransferase involved in polyketide biosynthesis